MRQLVPSQEDFINILKGEYIDFPVRDGKIEIKDIIFPNEYEVDSGSFNHELYFENVTFNNLFYIKGGKYKYIRFKDCHNINIYAGTFIFLSISDEHKISKEGISYNINSVNDLNIKAFQIANKRNTSIFGAYIKKCTLFLNNENLSIINCKICDFELRGNYELTITLNLNYNQIQKLKFDQCNIRNINFSNVKTIGDGSISFIRTNIIENVRFYNCDFSNYKIDSFIDSDISNVLLPNSSFPIRFKSNSDSLNRELYYRTLKKVYGDSGNFTKFSEFRAYEYEMIFKNIKVSIKNAPNIILLFFNKISNFHGTRWHYAFLEIFFIGFVFYFFYIKSMNLNICDNMPQFLYFLLPIHPIDYICEYCISNKTILIDTTHRIINSYLIYQLIVAFRRYGR